MLPGEQTARGKEAPPEELAPADLTVRERAHDFGAIVTGLLRFPDASARCILRQIHVQPLTPKRASARAPRFRGGRISDGSCRLVAPDAPRAGMRRTAWTLRSSQARVSDSTAAGAAKHLPIVGT